MLAVPEPEHPDFSTLDLFPKGLRMQFILAGSSTPRLFLPQLIEWYKIVQHCFTYHCEMDGPWLWTFETILYENGDIKTQYLAYTYGNIGITGKISIYPHYL